MFILRTGWITAIITTAVLVSIGHAQELVELKVDSTPRRYSDKNPLQAAKQEFSLSKAGIVKLVFKSSMIYKDAHGGQQLEEVELRNYSIGTGVFQQRVPDSATPGQPYHFEQHWLCANRDKPLNLRALLVAPHFWDSPQLRGTGEQLAANQVLTVSFVPFDKISSEPGPAAEIDVTGKWVHGDENATLTLTPSAVAGEYECVEKGYDNIRGIAHVKGRKVYIDWTTTTARDGKQKRGVTIVEVKPDGTHAEGWSVGDGGVGGERWSALPGTSAKPLPSPAGASPGSPPSGKMNPTSEYQIMDLPVEEAFGPQLADVLKEQSSQGWELVGILSSSTSSTVRLVWKRSK